MGQFGGMGLEGFVSPGFRKELELLETLSAWAQPYELPAQNASRWLLVPLRPVLIGNLCTNPRLPCLPELV